MQNIASEVSISGEQRVWLINRKLLVQDVEEVLTYHLLQTILLEGNSIRTKERLWKLLVVVAGWIVRGRTEYQGMRMTST